MFPNVHTDKTSCQLISQLLIVVPNPRLTAKFIYRKGVSYVLRGKMPQPLSSGSRTRSIKMKISTKPNGQNYCLVIFIVSMHTGTHTFSNNSISYLEVPGVKRGTWSKFHGKDQQTLGATVKKKISRHGDLAPRICAPLSGSRLGTPDF
jgi:hypothetical protein